MDECLRAVSGFKGTEDLSDDKFLLGPFTSDCIKTKTISSAPFHGPEDPAASKEEVEICSLGGEQWSEAISKHLPLVLKHPSVVVSQCLFPMLFICSPRFYGCLRQCV